MRGDKIPVKVLSVQYIPNADPALLRNLKVGKTYTSLGIITTDCDDVSYCALDEATKKAEVRVAYARSLYAGSSNASTALAGEFIGILAGINPEEVRSGIEAAIAYIEDGAAFSSANDDDSIVYYAQCISSTGSYLAREARISQGEALAYLIAPPCEGVRGLDAALKAADVELKRFYGPPTETNFCGGLLTGDQAACQAACDAFGDAICRIADNPLEA